MVRRPLQPSNARCMPAGLGVVGVFNDRLQGRFVGSGSFAPAWLAGVHVGNVLFQTWRVGTGAVKIRPMNAHLDHVLDEALALVPQERSALVLALLDSLDGDDEASAASAWVDEIRQRKDDLRSGATKAVPWAEARARLLAL